MIYHDGSKIGELSIRGIPIMEVYYKRESRKIEKLWPEDDSPIIPIIDEILSCYYNGYWIDEYPWTDDRTWVD
jgi:hypothetical protein